MSLEKELISFLKQFLKNQPNLCLNMFSCLRTDIFYSSLIIKLKQYDKWNWV